MKTVWKFEIPNAENDVRLPAGSTLRHFAVQNGVPFVWAEVDTDAGVIERRTLVIVGTGQPVPDGAHYIDTCLEGPFVWHLYEMKH